MKGFTLVSELKRNNRLFFYVQKGVKLIVALLFNVLLKIFKYLHHQVKIFDERQNLELLVIVSHCISFSFSAAP